MTTKPAKPMDSPSLPRAPLPVNDALPDEIAELQAGLVQCPFCAGHLPITDGRALANAVFKPVLLKDDVAGWWVRCWSCSARISGTTPQHAAKRWNARA